MTYEEAVKILRNKRNLGVTLEEAHAYMLAIKAMELQVAKNVKDGINPVAFVEYYCPSCGNVVGIGRVRNVKHCLHCGQKLDWSEE